MKKNFKIIFTAEQKGGFDAFLPVIKKLNHIKKSNIYLFLDNKSIHEFAKKKGIGSRFVNSFSLDKIDQIINKINPDIVLTDTSSTDLNSSISKKFIKSAKKSNKPTASLIDYWNKYKERLGKKLEYLSDNILVADNEMKKHLIDIGVSPELIKVTGNPRFDRFFKVKKEKEKENLIVFYSQPLYNQKPDELEIFKDIVCAIESFYPNKEIIIKFHPTREENPKDKVKYDNIIKNSTIKIKKAGRNVESENLSNKAELIIGINSTALFDASLMQKRVISYQPGKNISNDTLLSNTYGWSRRAYNKNKLHEEIKNIFKKRIPYGKKRRTKYTRNKSTDKIIKLINNILKHGS